MAETPISTPADAAAAGLKPNIGPMPGTVPGGDTGGPQTPTTGELQAPLEQPTGGPPVRAGFRDQGLRPPSRPGVVGKAKDVAEYTAPHALGEIFQTLAGGKKKEWVDTPNGPVAQYRDLKPGEMARGILAAAITGLASGYDPARRGKGPAMASAFSAGFKGEQEARDTQADQAQKEAQEKFQNKQKADEITLQKQRLAVEQQNSISEMRRTNAEIEDMTKRAAREDRKWDDEHLDRTLQRSSQYNGLIQSGYTEVKDASGKPHVFASPEAAGEVAAKNANALLRPGEFDTITQYNPNVSGWVVLQRPKNYDTKTEVRFAKLDADGNPMKDSNGKWIPDGTKDSSGRPNVPAYMTGLQYKNWLQEESKSRDENASAADRLAQAEERRSIQRKNDMLTGASDRMFKAGNQPWAVNLDTGLPYMTDSDRKLLRNAAHDSAADYQKTLNLARQKLMVATTPAEIAEAKDIINKAQAGLDEQTATLAAMGAPVNKETALANSVVSDTLSPEGKLDGKKTLDRFDDIAKSDAFRKAGWTPDELARARALLVDKVQKQAKETSAAVVKAQTNEMTAKGKQMAPVSLSSVGSVTHSHPELNAKTLVDDLNALTTPQARSDYIDKLQISSEEKNVLRKGSITTETGKKIKIMYPDGATFTITPDQLEQAKSEKAVVVEE